MQTLAAKENIIDLSLLDCVRTPEQDIFGPNNVLGRGSVRVSCLPKYGREPDRIELRQH
jgi:hypothetical protein